MHAAVAMAGAALGATVGVIGLAPAQPASAHSSGHDSVDGCEIRAEDQTTVDYDVERHTAIDAWQALAGDDCVLIKADTWSSVADLEWRNADEPGAHSDFGNVMYANASPVCRLAPHDIADYEALWGTSRPGPTTLPPTTLCPRCEEK